MSIERFILTGCIVSAEESAALSRILGQLTSLKVTQWQTNHDCIEDIIVQLSSFPALEALCITCPPPPRNSTLGPGFDSLSAFNIMVQNLDDFTTRLALVTSIRLAITAAQLSVDLTAPNLQTSLDVVRDRLAHASTAHVELETFTLADALDDDGIPMPAETIGPLLSLANLTVLRLYLHRPVDVDDALLKIMVADWPRLQTLEPLHEDGVQVAKVTLTGLIPFATHCTELTECAFLVNTTSLDEDSFLPPSGQYTSPVAKFHFGHSPISDALRIAAFLSDLFPQLHEIDTLYHPLRAGWRDVNSSIAVFTELRRQEREFALKLVHPIDTHT
ncbi:hypothetical protein DFH09DRAFT_1077980 [Mycena vulgaris]|nr:hypothetical protein DFH09DRAFT_1077980 [Mycena vulgaris]